MENAVKECKKIIRRRKIFTIAHWCLCAILILTGIIGLIVSVVKGNDSLISLFCIIGFVLPIVLFIGFIIWVFTDKSSDKINEIIISHKLTADEIMMAGDKLNINMFSLALKVRCIDELGMEGIPVWCARDGVLPTKKEV